MDDLIKTILLGVLEGITEFLPVSSTGHLFIAQNWLGVPVDETPEGQFWKAFGIVIQIGAIFAVLVYFRRRIIDLLLGTKRPSYFAKTMPRHEIDQAAWALTGSAVTGHTVAGPGVEPMTKEEVEKEDSYLNKQQRHHAILMVIIATIPVLAVGLGVKYISERLEEFPVAIAMALVIGGILMWIIEKIPVRISSKRMEKITLKQAIIIGVCQILAATFPGTSRSASTIMSGIACGVSREAATEFSFFLAIPAMFAACGYKMMKWLKDNKPDGHHMMLMGVGTFVSFVVAWVVIAGFMNYIRRHTFVGFAVWRIVFGLFVIGWWWKTTHG